VQSRRAIPRYIVSAPPQTDVTIAEGSSTATEGAVRRPRRRLLVAGLGIVALAVATAVTVAVTRDGGSDAPGPDEALASDRLDVAIVGDSLIEQSRDQFAAHAGELGLTVEAVAFGGSAPCDWQDEFEHYAAERPRALIVSFAGNDNTPCINPTGGGFRDPQTIADAYAAMVPGILDLYEGTGTDLYLVLPPPVGPPASEPAAAAIRDVYRAIGAARDDVTVVDPTAALGGDGAFHQALPCEAWEQAVCSPDGTVAVRRDDGIHLTEAGGERYARALLAAMGHPVAD
jgi:hypothetical protein